MLTSDRVADMPPRARVHETERRSLKDIMYSFESLYWSEGGGGHLGGRGGEQRLAASHFGPCWCGDAFKGRTGLGVKRKFYVSKQVQNVTHATLTYAPSECGMWIGIWFAKRMPNKYVL